MAVLAVLLELGVSFDELAGHDELFKQTLPQRSAHSRDGKDQPKEDSEAHGD